MTSLQEALAFYDKEEGEEEEGEEEEGRRVDANGQAVGPALMFLSGMVGLSSQARMVRCKVLELDECCRTATRA